ncbi:hypothetical protein OG455_41740 [Kitasatospora sp. NBC_01287]|uniref:hypothetical protein n=1 Tax=Kitasatospora sp. NBC_01287 TaxID=2903573 RepID=UPI00224F5690|nr:hypothetical protein [Kitasatospora sp. NBC_01287]MCX4751741.1 hypothetical protein [Kitasatospora sp. NBC_01287]MCX4751967.1 hypothetical protein [Kitasatospora sp. NBC_01287]
MTYRRLKGQTKPLGIAWDDTTRLWFWDCRICPGIPVVGHAGSQSGALTKALLHAKSSSRHQAPICRCDEPGADPYECEADDCTYEFPELNPFAGAPRREFDAKVIRICPHCAWLTSSWHVDDGSAEAELHGHITRVHPAAAPTA